MLLKRYRIYFLCALIISSHLCNAASFMERPVEGWWQYAKDAFWGADKPLPIEVQLFNKYNKEKEVPELLNRKPCASPVSIMQDNEWDELSINALLPKLDRTKTHYGKWGLKKSIIPHTDKQKLFEMQERISVLLEDSKLLKKLNNCMTQISERDDALLAYFNPNNSLHKQAEGLYFSVFDESLNTSEKALEATYVLDVAKTVLALAAAFNVTGIAQEVFGEESATNASQEKSILKSLVRPVKESFKIPFRYHSLEPVLLKDADVKKKIYDKNVFSGLTNVGAFGSLGDQQLYMTEHLSWYSAPAIAFWGSYLALYDVGVGLNIRNAARHLAFLHEVTKGIKKQTADIAHLFEKTKELITCSARCPVLYQWAPIVYLESFMYGIGISSKLAQLIKLLEDPVFFAAQDSLFASRGKLLLAHRLLTDMRKEFVPFLQAIGHVDALLSIANLYHEHQDKPNKFCFVEYVDSEQACCDLKDFWQPMVEGDVVTNQVTFGFNDQPNKIIFTGPNGGGKSTTMQAISYAFVLGLSWGIAPASSARISVLSGIRTALNPQANITKGLSTFMAEKLRMDQITSFLKSHSNKPVLVILDEPFKGTVESESAYRICEFGQTIAQQDNCMLLMATHLEKPIYLQESMQGKFANYQLEFMHPAPKVFKQTYKLLPGPALWWFQNEELRRAYIDSLLFDASLFAQC